MNELDRVVFNQWIIEVEKAVINGYTELEARDVAIEVCINLFGENITREVEKGIEPLLP